MIARARGALAAILFGVACSAATASPGLSERAEVQAFIADMVGRHGFVRKELDTLFRRVRLDPDVIRLMTTPPEVRSWQAYRTNFVNERRIAAGVQFWAQHAPALERDYYACEGVGAFRSDARAAGRPIRVAKRGAGAVRVVGSRSHRGSSLDSFLARVGEHELVEVGSSLKLCLVAEGKADVYPRLGPTSEWDTAAGQCVLEQAGGHVLKLDGQPLEYNRENTLNPSFVGFADADTDWLALVR